MFILTVILGVLGTMGEKTHREALRAFTLGGTNSRRKNRSVAINGHAFELRELTYGERADLLELGKVMRASGEEYDGNRILLWTIIRCTYDPADGSRVFEDTDYDVMRDQPISNPVMEALSKEAGKMMTGFQEEDLKNASADSGENPNALL